MLMNNNFNKLTNLIYSNIGKRIKAKKKISGKKRYEIYSNVELLSNIINNHRIKSRNPYLLTNSATDDIVKNLNFSSNYQLIWGENDELDSILHETFFTGLNYINSFSDPANKNLKHINSLLDACLKDYLPFALCLAQSELGKIKDIPEPLAEPIDDLFEKLTLAEEHLYWYVKYEFAEMHLKYFKDMYIKKIDQKLAEFYIQELPKLFKNYLNNTDYAGQKAYNIMTDIFNYEISSFEDSFQSAEWLAHQPVTPSGRPISEIREKIIDAGNAYISVLIDAQKESEDFP